MRSSCVMMEPVSVVTDWLGALAALLTTGSFLPQALLTLKTRDVSGISAGMYALFTAGVALWLVYGVLLGQWPIILANAVTLVLAGLILGTKWRVDRAQSRTGKPGSS
jgi:MtN3 and saliva related transmembrane protein